VRRFSGWNPILSTQATPNGPFKNSFTGGDLWSYLISKEVERIKRKQINCLTDKQ
jgi:hypothetical protein